MAIVFGYLLIISCTVLANLLLKAGAAASPSPMLLGPV